MITSASSQFPASLISQRAAERIAWAREMVKTRREESIQKIMTSHKRWVFFGPLPDREKAEKIYRRWHDGYYRYDAEAPYLSLIARLKEIERVASAAVWAGVDSVRLGYRECEMLDIPPASPAGKED